MGLFDRDAEFMTVKKCVVCGCLFETGKEDTSDTCSDECEKEKKNTK